jgi:hypothetical protein
VHYVALPKRDTASDSDAEFDGIGATWTAPKVFGITDGDERAILLRSLGQLRHKVGRLGENLVLDFSATERMAADGTLLFFAELRRLIKFVKGGVEISIILPHNSKVRQVLKQIGILDLMTGVNEQIVPTDDDVVNWRVASGSRVEGEQYDVILKQYDGEITPILQDSLYTGITEAMTNVSNHAYDLVRGDGLEIADQKTWWMFSQEKDGQLWVAFCDLGAGIPRTLPVKRKRVWNRLWRKGLRTDAEIIKFAVKDSVSRTRKSHRGNGLRQITEVIRGLPDAEVVVCSNRGVFMKRSGGESRILEHRDSILGTLIFWRIPLPSKEDV